MRASRPTLAALAARRPTVRVAGYTGYTEQVGPYRITYALPGSLSEGQAPPDGARLQHASATRTLDQGTDAQAAWRARTRELATALGVAPTCHRLDWPAGRAWLAVWPAADADVYVLGQPAFAAPAYDTPAAVRTCITEAGEAVARAGGTAQPMACPSEP